MSPTWEGGGRAGCQEQWGRGTEVVLRIQDFKEEDRV